MNYTKILVTGGSGFIGSNFIRHILKINPMVKVTNLDIHTYAGKGKNFNLPMPGKDRLEQVVGDICDKNIVDDLVKDKDFVVHFAAESHVDRSIIDPSIFLKTNIIGTQVLLDAVTKYDVRFHHMSTDEVFGDLDLHEDPFKETDRLDPHSPYSVSKASSDLLVKSYIRTYGTRATISNCSNNYGPYQFPEKLIPLAITNLILNKPVPIYGNGKNIRDWIYVIDHCEAIMDILINGKIGESYNIGADQEKTNVDVIRTICSVMNKKFIDNVEFVTDRLGHDRRYAIDSTKIKHDLSWYPKVKFLDGISKTIAWYIDNEKWWSKLKK